MTTASPETVLRVSGLTKNYGDIVAVRGLDLELRRGEVFGLLGPNGSGKSTTLGCVLGLITPTAGRIEAFGLDLNRHRWDVLRRIGAIVETPALFPYLSGRDNLRALAVSAGGVPAERIEHLLRLVGLADRAGDKFKTYSLGMKQRLGIATTLLTEPDLVILDEPTNGLDPAGQREVRALIPELAAQGHTVVLASHLLHDVELVCDRVAIMRRGELVAAGAVAELLHRGERIEIELAPAEIERAETVVRSVGGVAGVTRREGGIVVEAARDRGRELSRALAAVGIYPNALWPVAETLEDYFLELTSEEGPADA